MDEQERRRREDRSAYLNELLKRTDEDWNEDMMHVLLDQRVSANINARPMRLRGLRAAGRLSSPLSR